MMEEIEMHEKIALLAIAYKGAQILSSLPKEWLTSKEFVMECIQYDPVCLYYASEELKDDEEVVFSAIQGDSICMSLASKRLQNDKEFNLRCFKQCPMYTRHYASRYIKTITSKTMKRHGFLHYITALEYIIETEKVNAEKKLLEKFTRKPQVVCAPKEPRRL